ncbi:MAG: outer membrane lipoprotein LolB [Patiriisocius sp.]|jgi:outer membrane lipoprotein LolB
MRINMKFHSKYTPGFLKHKLSNHLHMKLITTILMTIGLMACNVRPALEDQAVINVNNNLTQLTQWKLKGKIAWITPTQRRSAYMYWQQEDANKQFGLSNVLGMTLVSLAFDGQLATLLFDGKEYQGPSPAMLVYQTTGLQVPLEALSSWVKGAPSVDGRSEKNIGDDDTDGVPIEQKITRFENGLIKQIKPICANISQKNAPINDNCNQWTIDYTSYTNATINNVQYQLPMQISMFNSANQTTIKMKISEWSQ